MSSATPLPNTPTESTTVKRQDTEHTLRKLLSENHREWDIIYHGYFANHSVHMLYALYQLGAPSERMEEFFAIQRQHLDRLRPAKANITHDNWRDYFGVPRIYSSYLKFFEKEVQELGFEKAFDHYVPILLPWMTMNAGHPLIHLGYAVEFRDPMVLSEALAFSASVSRRPEEFIDQTGSNATAAEQSFVSVIEQVRNDKRFDKVPIYHSKLSDRVNGLLSLCKDELLYYYNQALITEDNVNERFQELFNAASIIYAGCAHNIQPDFFLVHGLTSAHAVSVVYPNLPVHDQVRLLRTHWLFLLMVYIVQGRLPVNLAASIGKYTDETKYTWPKIISGGIHTNDEHVTKTIYSMQCAEKAYGAADGQWRAIAALTEEKLRNNEWRHHASEPNKL